jgi:hypothetical protein
MRNVLDVPSVLGASLTWLAFFQDEPLKWARLVGEVVKLHCGRQDGNTRGPEPHPDARDQLRSYRELFG